MINAITINILSALRAATPDNATIYRLFRPAVSRTGRLQAELQEKQ
jgi:hypothetical protein